MIPKSNFKILGVAMWMMPAPKTSRSVSEEAGTNEPNRVSEETRNEETGEEGAYPHQRNGSPRAEGEGNAYGQVREQAAGMTRAERATTHLNSSSIPLIYGKITL